MSNKSEGSRQLGGDSQDVEINLHFCEFLVLLIKEFKIRPSIREISWLVKVLAATPRDLLPLSRTPWRKVRSKATELSSDLHSHRGHQASTVFTTFLLRCLVSNSPVPRMSEHPHLVLVKLWN